MSVTITIPTVAWVAPLFGLVIASCILAADRWVCRPLAKSLADLAQRRSVVDPQEPKP